MMPDDMARVMRRIRDLPDRELVRMLDLETNQYTDGALSIAEEEVEARGGLPHLRERIAVTSSAASPPGQADEPLKNGPTWPARLTSALIGSAPSDAYPALGYVAIGLRLLSLLFAALAVVLFSSNSLSLLTGTDLPGLFSLMGIYPALLFLLLFGASELIHVFTDMAADTRESRDLLRSLADEHEHPKDDAP